MMPYPCPTRQENTMMTNTENPTGEIRVALAKSTVQALITGAFYIITTAIPIYSIFYLFGFHFRISQVITVIALSALMGATIGASVYLRWWAPLIIIMTSICFTIFFIYMRFDEMFVVLITALVPLLAIAAVAWRPLRSPHPRQGVAFVDWSNWFFRRKGT
jgi:hypothetical protein